MECESFYKSDIILETFVRHSPCAGFYDGGRNINNIGLVLASSSMSQCSSQDGCVNKQHSTKQEMQHSHFSFVKQFKWLCFFVKPT